MKTAVAMLMAATIGLTGRSSNSYDVGDVQRVVFETSSFDGSTYFEADLTGKTLTYAEPDGSGTGPEQTCRLTEEQIEHLLNVLAQEQVLRWKAQYPDHSEYEDGMQWSLTIHTPEGTHESQGENIEPAPENFTDVRDGLNQLVEAQHCSAKS